MLLEEVEGTREYHYMYHGTHHERPAPGTVFLSRLGALSGTAVVGTTKFTGTLSKLRARSRS